MSDRSIIFSAPMVRALIGGSKTQHRALLKQQPNGFANLLRISGKAAFFCDGGHPRHHACEEYEYAVKLPFASGDRLWVREAWNEAFEKELAPGERIERTRAECVAVNRGFSTCGKDGLVYGATGAQHHPQYGKALWRPSTTMSRWASRLTLTVTDVRVQRLCSISAGDVHAEGVEWGVRGGAGDYRHQFKLLWEKLHGPGAWEANPWVSAITFTVEQRNIDEVPS